MRPRDSLTRLPLPQDSHEKASGLRERIRSQTLRAQSAATHVLLESLADLEPAFERASTRAARWVDAARSRGGPRPLVERLLQQFPLSSAHGRALMSLAEALLRTADITRANQLVAEKLAEVRKSNPHISNDRLLASGLALLGLGGRLLPEAGLELDGRLQAAQLSKPIAAPLIRRAVRQFVRMLGRTFIVGENIDAALARSRVEPALALCSFDMLGEGARTFDDAARYFESYARAIEALRAQKTDGTNARSGISVKLSALEPRYSPLQRQAALDRLLPRMTSLARDAADANVGLTIDAEEADRLDLSLDLFAALSSDVETRNWCGLGLAIQCYGHRASLVVDWVAEVARASRRRINVRLVKGAYWDSEIKVAQERGLAAFPVHTSKAATDASYIECARRVFASSDVLYAQFATHNALTLAVIMELAPPGVGYEFQRLHGMGEALYATVRNEVADFPPVRVYAPVGEHRSLLPYLVRRLLENGANSSFVHQFLDPGVPAERLVRSPLSTLRGEEISRRICVPRELFAPERANSAGIDWGNPAEVADVQGAIAARAKYETIGGPIINGRQLSGSHVRIVSPASSLDLVGRSRDATTDEIRSALEHAARAQPAWDALAAGQRAACLERAADLLEQRRTELLGLLIREAGKTLPDATAEIREAVDFCRYYAAQGRKLFDQGMPMPGPTGESNMLSLHGRGVFVCISPWNFPLALFMGQVAAALMAGNAVVAKPAPATPLIAHATTRLLHDAGVPTSILHLTPAPGPTFSEAALTHSALAGVAFTGSTATAMTINRTLANRSGAIVPLIAETGGVNAMIVDATALPEQVVDDAIASAFTSAGQRCSALRVLYLQEEIADRVLEVLVGAMKCLVIGDPSRLATDVGPMIDGAAVTRMREHAERMRGESTLLHACALDASHERGHFFPPHLFELRALDQVGTEIFGPILHVARYRADDLPRVLEAIRATQFGLTLGVHSRLASLAAHVFRSTRAGNVYVNRNMIGAVVGVQPFGGQGLSGTGPKAGGPHYLPRFAAERTLTLNTAAAGGNVELMA
ncbi:MAG: bifunctional proline dehydrogenase/L-glutamate gamma-semialdehyde dehydrogenase PutA [Gammaproteobacteria bacterium]